MDTFLSLVAGIFGGLAGGLVGSFIGFFWSYFSFRPGPGDNSESSSIYALDVGAFYGGWMGLVVGALLVTWSCWRYLQRAYKRPQPEKFPTSAP